MVAFPGTKALLLTVAFANLGSAFSDRTFIPEPATEKTVYKVYLFEAASISLSPDSSIRDGFSRRVHEGWGVLMDDSCGFVCDPPDPDYVAGEYAVSLLAYLKKESEQKTGAVLENFFSLCKTAKPPIPADKLKQFLTVLAKKLDNYI